MSSLEYFRELLEELEAGNSKFVKPHIIVGILKWFISNVERVEQLLADSFLDDESLDEDSVVSGGDTSAGPFGPATAGSVADSESLEAKSVLSSSANPKLSPFCSPIEDQQAISDRSCSSPPVTPQQQHRMPSVERPQPVTHPHGALGGESLLSYLQRRNSLLSPDRPTWFPRK